MLMPSISLDTSPGPAAAPDPAAAGAPGPDGAASFATKLGQVMEAGPAVGQNLAAVGLPLKTLALGPTLEVLTASSEPVDSDSLAEFAKAQGLDEEVVAWLFADPAQAAALQSPVVPGLIPGLVPPPSPAAAAAGLEAIVAGDPGLGAALPASAAPSASLTTPWTAMAPVDAGLADGTAPAAPGPAATTTTAAAG